MKGIIYKLICNETNEVYYGSTTQKINKRISSHKKDHKRWKAGKTSFVTSFQIIERGNYTYEVVEEVVYENKKQLEERERYYIENNDCINKNIPTRSNKEYCEANKDTIKEYKKEWYVANKDKMKEYNQANKEKIKEYMKEYNQANKDQRKEYDKARYQANKDAINARRRELRLAKKNNVIIE
jgi:hypothetical protein